jgi:hypothetical protein
MSLTLPAERKFSFSDWKMTAMMIRPRMTGSEPSSPPRTLRLNSVR